MVSKPKIQRYFPVVPKNVLESLHIKDALTAQRKLARDYLQDGYDIFNAYYTDGSHPLVSPDNVRWILARNDHTTLRPTANEDADFMRKVLTRSLTPLPTRATCSREEQIRMLVTAVKSDEELQKLVADNPGHMLACVSGTKESPAFPHFYTKADQIWRDLEGKAKLKEEAAEAGLNLAEYDSVIPYMHWLDGDTTTVSDLLKAEAEACKEFGFTWKSILKVSVHAHVTHNSVYGDDYFRSVYDATKAVLEAGADCVKTSTGLGALPPLNDLVAKDDGSVIPKSLPMMVALRDFNKANDAQRWPKYSGGHAHEADGAVLKHLTEEICGAEVADKMVIGAGTHFRDRNIQYIYEVEGSDSGITPSDFEPYGHDFDSLPAFRRGWSNSLDSVGNEQLPPELLRVSGAGPNIVDDMDVPGL